MSNQMQHIAQLNISRMIGVSINDDIMKDFVAQLDEINLLGEQSEGFVWRLKSDDGNATSYNPYSDDRIIVNFTVWETAAHLKNFVYNTAHRLVMKDRKKWFENLGQPSYVLWHIPAGTTPTLADAVERLAHLQTNGPSAYAFDFKNIFTPAVI
jgi:Domain of unknown function (DUF3291)